jgi:hypothetical protein
MVDPPITYIFDAKKFLSKTKNKIIILMKIASQN